MHTALSAHEDQDQHEHWTEHIDEIDFAELEDNVDWRQYKEYLSLRTVKSAVKKLKELQAELRTKAVEKSSEAKENLKARFHKRKEKI